MAPKPTEVKKLVALLEADHEDATAAAKAVFNLVEEMLWTREHYVLVAVHGNGALAQAIGPYPTRDKLMKDKDKRIIAPDSNSWYTIAMLRHPSTVVLP